MKFVREYLHDQNATRAMVRAGYSARTASKHAPRLLRHPDVKRLIKAGLSDQEAAIKLASVNLLVARLDEARQEIMTARDELVAANRRVKQASATVADIERLAAPKPEPAPARPAGPAPLPAPATAQPEPAPAPILPRAAPRIFGDWIAPDPSEGVTFADGGRSDFETNPYQTFATGLIAGRN